MSEVEGRGAWARDEKLDALIRLVTPARALKEDLEKRLFLELYGGIGDFAIQSFHALQASVAQIVDDPYLGTMTVTVPETAGDKEKVSLAALAASQLLAYLAGQTGIAVAGVDVVGGSGGGTNSHNITYSTGVHITIDFHDNTGISHDTYAKLADLAKDATAKGLEQAVHLDL